MKKLSIRKQVMNDKEMKASLPKPEEYASETRKYFSSKINYPIFSYS